MNVSSGSILTTFVALMLLLVGVSSSQAQSREDVINSFNEGFALFNEQGDNMGAIEKFKETIELADRVGSEANDIRERAVGQIPRLAFMYAAEFVRQRQLREAIDAFHVAIELAEEFDDAQISQRARSNLPALHLNLGNLFFRDNENEAALEEYRKAVELNPSYVTAYYQMGLVHRRFGELEKALENLDISIDLAREAGDADNVDRAQRAARDYLVFLAADEIEMENYNRALDYLNLADGYGDNSSLHYRFAETYNYMGRHGDALASAQKALELETGGAADLARIYFELGVAHKMLGNNSQACSAFGNALVGDFRAPAEHFMEHELDCN